MQEQKKENKEEKQDILSKGYSILPNKVLFDTDLSSTDKLVYALISSLCAQTGYCYATNKYLANKMNVQETTMSAILSRLKKYLRFKERKSYKRRIYLSYSFKKEKKEKKNNLPKNHKVPSEKSEGNLPKNHKHNNINRIDKLNSLGKQTKKPLKEKTNRQLIEEFLELKDTEENRAILNPLYEKYNKRIVDDEIRMFCSYWTERNLSGKKQRWELEKTFEINKRLLYWLRNSNKYNKFKGQGKTLLGLDKIKE